MPIDIPGGGQCLLTVRYQHEFETAWVDPAVLVRLAGGFQPDVEVSITMGDIALIRNINELAFEIHTKTCDYVRLITPNHLRFICWSEYPNLTMDALCDDEYDGCYYCLGAWHRK